VLLEETAHGATVDVAGTKLSRMEAIDFSGDP